MILRVIDRLYYYYYIRKERKYKKKESFIAMTKLYDCLAIS